MFAGEIIPKVGFVIVADDWLIESKSLRRIHNRVSKQAGSAVMLMHWKKYMPLHFKRGNRQRYNHKERTKKYLAKKRKEFKSVTDLVKTGGMRDYMLSVIPRIRISGKAENLMVVRMILKRPFPVPENPGKGKVGVDDQNRELETWFPEEEQEAMRLYRDTYVADWREATKNRPKLTKQFNEKYGA